MSQFTARCMGNQLCRNMGQWLTRNPDCALGVVGMLLAVGLSGAPDVTTLSGGMSAGTEVASVGIDCLDRVPGTRHVVVEKRLGAVDDTVPQTFWKKRQSGDKTVYQRDDLIDPARIDEWGQTSLQLMCKGKAPIGPDGKRINLHHMLQTEEGPLAEVTTSFHQRNTSVIHINPSTIPSGIDRPSFKTWRADYWVQRANDFGGC